ncbi:MAG: hypothetical protein JXA66_08350 [Oligoflexia bacterium]|nr:hypothetical protein [Oligoflexia bacterium]
MYYSPNYRVEDLIEKSEGDRDLADYFSRYRDNCFISIDDVADNMQGKLTDTDRYFLLIREVSRQRACNDL